MLLPDNSQMISWDYCEREICWRVKPLQANRQRWRWEICPLICMKSWWETTGLWLNGCYHLYIWCDECVHDAEGKSLIKVMSDQVSWMSVFLSWLDKFKSEVSRVQVTEATRNENWLGIWNDDLWKWVGYKEEKLQETILPILATYAWLIFGPRAFSYLSLSFDFENKFPEFHFCE